MIYIITTHCENADEMIVFYASIIIDDIIMKMIDVPN